MKINKHIEIVRSSAPGLGSMGQTPARTIQRALASLYERVGITIVNDTYDLDLLALKQPDLIFLGTKRVPTTGSNGHTWVSEYLDKLGLAYTGSPAQAIALDFDKPAAKKVVARAGLPTAGYFRAIPGRYETATQLPLGFPLFIKPPSTGGGKGIGDDSVARDFAAFQRQVSYLADHFVGDALIENYLPGREFSVGILETAGSDKLIAMPIELVAAENHNGDQILGHSVKSADTERILAVEDGSLKQSLIRLASDAFRALGARDYGRIDIRLDEQGAPHFLEANLIPGLHTETSYFTKACLINDAMSYEAMVLRIAALAFARTTPAQTFIPEPTHRSILDIYPLTFEPI